MSNIPAPWRYVLAMIALSLMCASTVWGQPEDDAEKALKMLDEAMQSAGSVPSNNPAAPENSATTGTPVQEGRRAVVRDDENNLREFGGREYKRAKIIGVLNQGDIVFEMKREGKWSEVVTEEGVHGWVHNACLNYAPESPAASTCSESLPRRFSVDLDGDGRMETISLIERLTPEGGEATLRVSDGSGRTLWKSPPAESDFRFFCRDDGIYWPGVIGDVDGDGETELLAREPQSDVSPSAFFIGRWENGAFRPTGRGWSLLEQPMNSGEFVKARYAYDGKPVAWIMDVKGIEKNGDLRVTAYQDTGDGVRYGVALFRMTGDSGKIVRWLEPLR